jgi:hypothetical protein
MTHHIRRTGQEVAVSSTLLKGIFIWINHLRSFQLIYQGAKGEGSQDDDQHMPVYVPWRCETVWRTVDPPILYQGKPIRRHRVPVVIEYLDPETGEIIPTGAARKRPGFCPEIYFSERMLQRQTVLDGLRKEVRHFALFVLKFRNYRRGITPGIETLVQWYSQLHQREPHHVRRHIGKLFEAGILGGENLVGSLFQRPGKQMPAKAHLQEDAKARLRFMAMWVRHHNEAPRNLPHWLVEVEAEMSRIVMDIMNRVRAQKHSSNWGASYECPFDEEELDSVTENQCAV